MNLRCLVGTVLLTLLCASCTSTPQEPQAPPTKKFVHTGPSHKSRLSLIRNVGIVTDACVVTDSLGSDYFSVEDSRLAGGYMLKFASDKLEQKGYKISFQSNPFVCSFIQHKTYDDVVLEDGSRVSVSPPFFTDDSLNNDSKYRQRLNDSMRSMFSYFSKGRSSDYLAGARTQRDLKHIAEQTNTEAILFIFGRGFRVPISSFTQDMVSGMVTGVLTLGRVIVQKHNVSWLDTYAGLVDLNSSEILWSNSIRLKEFNLVDQDFYAGSWSRINLYHIPLRPEE